MARHTHTRRGRKKCPALRSLASTYLVGGVGPGLTAAGSRRLRTTRPTPPFLRPHWPLARTPAQARRRYTDRPPPRASISTDVAALGASNIPLGRRLLTSHVPHTHSFACSHCAPPPPRGERTAPSPVRCAPSARRPQLYLMPAMVRQSTKPPKPSVEKQPLAKAARLT